MWSTFHHSIDFLSTPISSVLRPTGLFFGVVSRSGYLNLPCCDTRKKNGRMPYFPFALSLILHCRFALIQFLFQSCLLLFVFWFFSHSIFPPASHCERTTLNQKKISPSCVHRQTRLAIKRAIRDTPPSLLTLAPRIFSSRQQGAVLVALARRSYVTNKAASLRSERCFFLSLALSVSAYLNIALNNGSRDGEGRK